MNMLATSTRAGSGSSRKVAAHLTFAKARGRTILAAQKTPHPFHITRPFYVAGDPDGMATLYLQSSSGGLYGDDDLDLRLQVKPGAYAHVTTQASTIVHPARGGQTRQRIHLTLGPDSYLEYLPDPSILFAGANLNAELTADIGNGARLILCDSALAHAPGGQALPFGLFSNTIQVLSEDGRKILVDRSVVSGADWVRRTPRLPVHGLMIIAGAIDARQIADAIDNSLPAQDAKSYSAVCALPDKRHVTFRLLAADGAIFTCVMETAWRAARQALVGAAPMSRRK